MKALCCVEPERSALIEASEPRRGEGDVLVRIRDVGICGTDFHIFHGKQPYLEYPRVMGHELGGAVPRLPPAARFRPGEMVSIEPYLFVRRCPACRMGRPTAAASLGVLGVHNDGGRAIIRRAGANVVRGQRLTTTRRPWSSSSPSARRCAALRGQRKEPRDGCRAPGHPDRAQRSSARRAARRSRRSTGRPAGWPSRRDHVGVDHVFEAPPISRHRLSDATGGDFFDRRDRRHRQHRRHAARLRPMSATAARYVLLSIVRADDRLPDPEFHKRETRCSAAATPRRKIS